MDRNYGSLAYYGSTAEMLSQRDPDAILAAGSPEAMADPEFLNNIILEAGFSYDSADLLFLADAKQAAIAHQIYGLQFLQECVQDASPHFERVWKNAYETVNFFMGNHWTTDDEEEHLAKGLKPYSWPTFRPLVNSVLGEAVAQRADYRVIGLNERSQMRAQVGNRALRWVSQSNKLTNVKIDLTRDALLAGVSVAGTALDPMDPGGRVKVTRCRYSEFMWDMNSPTDSTLANVKWVLRETWVDRLRLAAEFPEWRKEILSASGHMTAASGFEESRSILRPKAKTPVGSAEITQEYDPTARQLYGRLLFRRELYVRRWVQRLVVTDPFLGKEYPCRTADQAMRQQEELEAYYMDQPVWQVMAPQLRERVFAPRAAMIEVIDQFIFIGNQLVRLNSDADGGIPYIFCAPEFYDGDVTPYFDHAKGPQRWQDRFMSFVDDLKAGAKGGHIINTHFLQGTKLTEEQIGNKINETNWKLFVNEDAIDFDANKVIAHVAEHQNPQVLEPIIRYLDSMNERAYGGPNMSGSAAFAGQSGKSAAQLRAAGSTLTLTAMDKIALSDCMLGQRALYLLGYLHPAAQMRVYGDDLKPEFFSLLTEGIETLRDYDFDVALVEVMASPTEKQARLQRLENILGYAPGIFEATLPLLLKNSDIEYTDRQEILQSVAGMRKAAEQAATEDRQMKRDEIMGRIEVNRGGLEVKTAAQRLAEQNLPKFNFTGKLPTDPLAMADFINWAAVNMPGFFAHPAMLAAGETMKALFDQSRLTMQQREEDVNTPDWEKDAVRHQVAVKKAHAKSKDAGNRAMREVRTGNAAP